MTAVQHPAWCTREGCAERGEHRSAEISANAEQRSEIRWYVADGSAPDAGGPVELFVVRARLAAFVDRPTMPAFVEILAFDDPADADDSAVTLSVDQAGRLSMGLAQLVHWAGDPDVS